MGPQSIYGNMEGYVYDTGIVIHYSYDFLEE